MECGILLRLESADRVVQLGKDRWRGGSGCGKAHGYRIEQDAGGAQPQFPGMAHTVEAADHPREDLALDQRLEHLSVVRILDEVGLDFQTGHEIAEFFVVHAAAHKGHPSAVQSGRVRDGVILTGVKDCPVHRDGFPGEVERLVCFPGKVDRRKQVDFSLRQAVHVLFESSGNIGDAPVIAGSGF